MLKFKSIFIALCCCAVSVAAYAANLSGTASVNITSETSATAKNMAMDEARRQIISDTLSQYANREQLNFALQNASASDLTDLIASSGIAGEKLSDTTYSANITMTLDGAAAKKWMDENDIQNWLTDGKSGDKFIAVITLNDKMANWMELRRIARNEKIDMFTKYIQGNEIAVELPRASRAPFTIAAREAGWHYSDADGALRLWK